MKAPYKAIEYIIENAPKFAEAKAQRMYLEEFRKTKKALLMKDALARGIDSAVAQEREAYAHIEYADLLRGLMVAIEKEETLKWMLTAAQKAVSPTRINFQALLISRYLGFVSFSKQMARQSHSPLHFEFFKLLVSKDAHQRNLLVNHI